MYTVRRRQIGDVGVVRRLARQDGHPCRTTHSSRGKVSLIQSSLINEMSLYMRHVIERFHVQVLVVGEDEDYVLALPGSTSATSRSRAEQRQLILDGVEIQDRAMADFQKSEKDRSARDELHVGATQCR